MNDDFSTYDLQADHPSGDYYFRVRTFTDTVEDRLRTAFSGIVARYTDHVALYGLETPRTTMEYAFELLMLGVFQRQYSARASGSPRALQLLCRTLFRFRQNHPRWKPVIDPLRGIFGTLFLSHRSRTSALPSRHTFERLILWLEATGEFKEESKRLRLWLDFLQTHPPYLALEVLTSAHAVAEWFTKESENVFGGYTRNVEYFRSRSLPAKRMQEDFILCGRSEAEYYLNMVGAEIMNRAYRADFQRTNRTVTLLPGCMRGERAATCRAKAMNGDLACTRCDATCAVCRLTVKGEREGFEVYIIPHSTDFSRWANKPECAVQTGVIGVACLLNLVGGGLELKANNIPAQCVPLSGTGCTRHWRCHETATSIRMEEFNRVSRKDKEHFQDTLTTVVNVK